MTKKRLNARKILLILPRLTVDVPQVVLEPIKFSLLFSVNESLTQKNNFMNSFLALANKQGTCFGQVSTEGHGYCQILNKQRGLFSVNKQGQFVVNLSGVNSEEKGKFKRSTDGEGKNGMQAGNVSLLQTALHLTYLN